MSTQSEILRFLLQGENKSLIDALNGADAALDGTETSAQRVAAQMSAMAKVIETEGKQAAAATEVLAAAMGSELVAAVERAGGSVQGIVADLNRAGVSYDDLSANADQLARSLREVESAGRAATGGDLTPNVDMASDSVRRLGHEADQSRSVLANMAGNSAQEMGALAGATGTVGVALGQLVEYAADGNVSMGGLAKMAGPMALVAGAMYGLSENAKAAAERTRDITEATKELSRVADEEVVKSLGRAMADAALNGQSMDELFSDMAENNLPGLKRAYDLLLESGQGTPEMLDRMAAAIADAEAEAAQAAETNREYGDATNTAADAVSRLYATHGQSAAGARMSAEAAAILNQRLQDYLHTVGEIPIDKYTEIRAALADGDLERAEALLNELTRLRVAQVVISVATAGAQAGMVGQGAAQAAAAAAGQGVAQAYWTAYNAAHAKGGSGSGGSGSIAKDEEVSWDDAMAAAYQYGEVTRQQYIEFLTMRLSGEEKYTDEHRRLWTLRQTLEKQAADEQEKAAKAALDAQKKAADEAKKAADEQKKLIEAQLSALQRIAELLGTLLLGDNGNLNMLGPNAIASADRQALGGFISDLLREFLDGNA